MLFPRPSQDNPADIIIVLFSQTRQISSRATEVIIQQTESEMIKTL